MKYEIINHGMDNSQYFQGCGTAFSGFNSCVTGCGSDAVEAYEDAVDQVWQTCTTKDAGALKLPTRPRGYGITRRDRVPARLMDQDSDMYWYVSIRF